MTYEETIDWVFTRLPMYQRQGKEAFKKDLTNIIAFAKYLGNPEKKFKTIHVGGTNGKGSTSHMIASVLQEAGYKVGLYTSPHLKNFTERVRVNGEEISKESVVAFFKDNKEFLERQGLSFFEMTVGLAFNEFAVQEVDIAVVEVGLGGRLDSTNIIIPEVSVITNIGLDHTQFLGETLPEIAFEKAGIIKNNIPVVIGQWQEETIGVFKKKAKECSAELEVASEKKVTYKTDLLGSYQLYNIKTAVGAIKKLKGFVVSEEHLKNGLLNVVRNTNLQGRWQVLQYNPKVICDTAHNKEGLTYVLSQLKKEKYEKLHIVLGMVSDKKVEDVLAMFPKEATYYFCKPEIPRGLCEKKLKINAKAVGLKGEVYGSVSEAFSFAKKQLGEQDLCYIGGSTFVVAEIL